MHPAGVIMLMDLISVELIYEASISAEGYFSWCRLHVLYRKEPCVGFVIEGVPHPERDVPRGQV